MSLQSAEAGCHMENKEKTDSCYDFFPLNESLQHVQVYNKYDMYNKFHCIWDQYKCVTHRSEVECVRPQFCVSDMHAYA